MNFLQITSGLGEDKNGQPLTPEQRMLGLEQTRKLLSSTFGGYTEIDSIGGWLNNEGRLVTEQGKTWQVALTSKELLSSAESAAKEVAKVFNQHSVFMVLDGKPMFIES